MGKVFWTRILGRQRGATLIEAIVAVFLVGTVVTGTIRVMGASARNAGHEERNVGLLQLVRSQIETIIAFPYQTDPANYPHITDIPDGYAVSFVVVDATPEYRYPEPTATGVTNVVSAVQQIEVTATGDNSELSMNFYKVNRP